MTLKQWPLRTTYDIPSLTNSTLLVADIILWCTKILFLIDDFRFFFHRIKYNPLFLQCSLCPTQPPVHTLNLIYASLIPWLLS